MSKKFNLYQIGSLMKSNCCTYYQEKLGGSFYLIRVAFFNMLNDTIFYQYCQSSNWYRPSLKVLVACSGGVDSTVLLHLLQRLPQIQISMVHFDHQLRGVDSDNDRLFVQELASNMGYPLHVISEDIQAYASQNGLSVEEAGSLRRRSQFLELKDQLKLLQKLLKDQQRLVKMGLITKITALNTQIQIDSRKKEIRQNNDQNKQLAIQRLQTRNRIQENLLTLETKLQIARDQLRTLRNNFQQDSKAISFYSGRIISVDVALGDVAQPGTSLMTVAMTGLHSRFLEAVLYFPATQGKRILQGMVAQISPSTVKRDQFGAIIGMVTSIAEFPASPESMKRVLQNEEMVQDLSKAGLPIEVRAALVPDSRTFSQYQWTSSKGPPIAIHAGTVCTASAIVKRQPPIQLVIPLMKKYVLGIGPDQTQKGL